MRFHQDFGVDQVPHQIEVCYSDHMATFLFCIYLRTIRFSFPCGIIPIIPRISSLQRDILSLGSISGVTAFRWGMQSHQWLSFSLFLFLSLLQPFQARRGPSPSQGESLKSRQSFQESQQGRGRGEKSIFRLHSKINRSKEIDDHSHFQSA